jgi:hypothetical protein
VLVVAPGLRLPPAQPTTGAPGWPESLRSLAASGAVGLMPSGQAAQVVAMVVKAGAPVLDPTKARDFEQLVQWASAPTTTVGVPAAFVVDLARGGVAGITTAEVASLGRVALALRESSSTCFALVAPRSDSAGHVVSALTPFVVSCPDQEVGGVVTSQSTRRTGLISSADVYAAVMSTALGTRSTLPASAADKGTKLDDRLAGLAATTDTVAAIDAVHWLVIGLWVATFLVLLALAGLAAWRAPVGSVWRTASAIALVVPLGLPLAAYITALVTRGTGQSTPILAVLAGVTALIAAATVALAASRGPTAAAGGILAVVAVVIAVDQWLGAPLLHANVVGYSIADGGRFYGLGNEGAGLLLGSIAAAAALWAPGRDAERAPRFALLSGAAFAVGLLTCVSPWWGANIGVALWGAPLLVIAWDGLRPADWPRSLVGVVSAGVVIVMAALVAADAALGLTHIGRSVVALMTGSASGTGMLSERASTALRTLTTNPWTIALLVLLAILAWLVFRPPADVRALGETRPAVRALLVAALVGSLVAIVTEDTGGSTAASLEALALTVLVMGLLAPPPADPAHAHVVTAVQPVPEVAP